MHSTGILGYEDVHEQVIEALSSGKITGLDTLITRKIPFEDVVEKGIKALLQEKDAHGQYHASNFENRS